MSHLPNSGYQLSFKLTSDEQNNSLLGDDGRSKYVAKLPLDLHMPASPTHVLDF